MSVAIAPKLMTTEELLAMPDDGVERWLINGTLHEKQPEFPVKVKGKPLTVRNRFHSGTMARISTVLNIWRDQQPEPRGQVLDGEAGVLLSSDPDSTVGIDVVYISPEVAAGQTDSTTLIAGVPVLAVEILSPSDTQGQIRDKVKTFLNSGVALVWVIDTDDQTVAVYRRGSKPQFFNADQELTAEPHLPGFLVAVAKLFE